MQPTAELLIKIILTVLTFPLGDMCSRVPIQQDMLLTLKNLEKICT